MQILGLQIDSPFLRIAWIEKTRRGIEIRCLKATPLAAPTDVKQLYIPKFKGRIVSGLPAKDLLIRPLEVKVGGHRYLEEVVSFQSEATTHFSPDEVISVPHFIKKGKEKTEALIFTASRSAMRDHLSELKKFRFDPDAVSAVPLALIRYVQWKIPSLTDAFLIDFGANEWTCAWMENGNLKRAYAIRGGMEMLFAALWEDRKKNLSKQEVEEFAKQIDLVQLKPQLNPHLFAKLSEMRQELSKIIFSFHRASTARPILFTGKIDAFGHLSEFLLENLKEAAHGERLLLAPGEELSYAIPIGLALDQTTSSLQLRKGEFFPAKNWKQAGLYALGLIASSFFISGSFLCLGDWISHSRKGDMISSLQSFLAQDPPLKNKIFANHSSSEEEIIDRWNRSVMAYAKESPYFLQAPRVAEVFSWLTSHPLLTTEKDPIQIRSFRYQLLQFPKIDSLQEPYQAKVEIEFQVKSPMNARKFHEALLQGDEWVNADLDIIWEVLDDFYRISFFLKNRSPHVP